jgi:hypothetical protein
MHCERSGLTVRLSELRKFFPSMHRAYDDLALAVLVAYTTSFYDTGYDQLIGHSTALALVFRRRLLLTVMTVVAALALTQYLPAAFAEPLAGELTGYDIAVLIAMVTVGSHAEEMWKAYAAGGIVVVGNVLAFGGISSLSSAADWDEFNHDLARNPGPFRGSGGIAGIGEDLPSVLGVKTRCAWRVWTTLRPLRISGFGSHRGDIDTTPGVQGGVEGGLQAVSKAVEERPSGGSAEWPRCGARNRLPGRGKDLPSGGIVKACRYSTRSRSASPSSPGSASSSPESSPS